MYGIGAGNFRNFFRLMLEAHRFRNSRLFFQI